MAQRKKVADKRRRRAFKIANKASDRGARMASALRELVRVNEEDGPSSADVEAAMDAARAALREWDS